MSEPGNLHSEVFSNLNLRETDDLIQIWRDNNRYEWTDEALQIVSQILQERLGELPSQNGPSYEPSPLKNEKPIEVGSPLNAYLDDEDLPEFYDPWNVLRLEKWIYRAAVGAIIITALQLLLDFSNYQRFWMTWFAGDARYNLVAGLLAILQISLYIGIEYIVMFLPLRALAEILKILMEMEFTSRGKRKFVEGITSV